MTVVRSSGMAALCAAVLSSCIEVDYDFKGKEFAPRVVVNALITPQEDFSVQLFWSGTYTSEDMRFEPVSGAEIRLLENGSEVVRCSAAADGGTNTAFRASAGRRYRLEVSVPGYGDLSAETTVPDAPKVRVAHAMYKGWYRHFDMDGLEMPADAKALWIRGVSRYLDPYTGRGDISDIGEYYTASLFVDQLNGANDAYEADEKGSTIDFERFLRISRENCKAALPLRFSVFGAPEENMHTFRIIAASDTYDRYFRSRYKQELNSAWDAEENPFVEQITVYSNISNGLGIFAGYNYFKTPEL